MADRISIDFGSLRNSQLWERGLAVVLALTGNVKYSNLPVSMAMLKSLLEAFQAALSDTVGVNQGSKRAMAARDSLRGQVISALKQTAVYVQENSNGDLSCLACPTRKSRDTLSSTAKARWPKFRPPA